MSPSPWPIESSAVLESCIQLSPTAKQLEFGTSGFLYQSNKLMYDRKTETLWHQFRCEPVVGPLAGSGIQLEMLPNALTTWSA